MILQHRDDAIRCILQHDHALLSGELALAWRPGLPQEMVLTIALHDLAWQPHNAIGPDTSAFGAPTEPPCCSRAWLWF